MMALLMPLRGLETIFRGTSVWSILSLRCSAVVLFVILKSKVPVRMEFLLYASNSAWRAQGVPSV